MEEKERILGKLVELRVEASKDFPSVEFHAEFALNGDKHNTAGIAEASINIEYVFGFLNAMGFVNKNPTYGDKRLAYRLWQDLLLEGFNKTRKLSRRYGLIGKFCWLTRESCIFQPYLVEPMDPKDGESFNIKNWKKKYY